MRMCLLRRGKMDKREIMLLTGIIIASFWLFLCVFMEGRKRRYVIITGILADLVLFLICKNVEMFLIGAVGGLICGLVPGFGGSLRKYDTAVRELNGVKHWALVSIILFVMFFMVISIAYPEFKVSFFD